MNDLSILISLASSSARYSIDALPVPKSSTDTKSWSSASRFGRANLSGLRLRSRAHGQALARPYSTQMRALVQRVGRAGVRVQGELLAEIGPGLLVLLGVTHEDDEAAAERLAAKVLALRVFPDAAGQMNEALGSREILCVSQFTLYGDTRRGNRPSFTAAARPELAEPLYELFCERCGAKRGAFGAHMAVELVNDGPVTLLLET